MFTGGLIHPCLSLGVGCLSREPGSCGWRTAESCLQVFSWAEIGTMSHTCAHNRHTHAYHMLPPSSHPGFLHIFVHSSFSDMHYLTPSSPWPLSPSSIHWRIPGVGLELQGGYPTLLLPCLPRYCQQLLPHSDLPVVFYLRRREGAVMCF